MWIVILNVRVAMRLFKIFICLSNLYTPMGLKGNPLIKSRMIFRLSQTGTPPWDFLTSRITLQKFIMVTKSPWMRVRSFFFFPQIFIEPLLCASHCVSGLGLCREKTRVVPALMELSASQSWGKKTPIIWNVKCKQRIY